MNILSRTSRLCRNGGFAQITFYKRLQTYMTGKCTSMNLYNTFFKKKKIDFKAEPSRMQSLHSTSEQYLHKADRTFPSSVSILKTFANGHFLKVVMDTVSFLPSDIFSSGSLSKRNSKVLRKYYILEKYLSLSIYKNIYFIHIKFRFFNGK